mmetsp:Transcript_6620/g.14088  ORF Transcript_6620/g.14088 Transcript_6620/m.14088 type:complete len:231 (+) Transcript_6620:269-961(+)
MPSFLSTLGNRFLLCLTTIPTTFLGWFVIIAIAIVTTATAAIFATVSGFVNPKEDYHPPWQMRDDGSSGSRRFRCHWSIKPLSAFIFPSLVEEVFWRGVLIGHPSAPDGGFSYRQFILAGVFLVVHVLMHPVAGYTCWPRGRKVFSDWRFMVGATLVLGGATVSYLVSGGSAYAAALTHGLCVALWRDFFDGEAKLIGRIMTATTTHENYSSERINTEEKDNACNQFANA